jgi:hypothetical protein
MVRPDMAKTNVAFIAGIFLLAGASWAMRSAPIHIDIPFFRLVCRGLYGAAGLFAVFAFTQLVKRNTKPWAVSSASVTMSYLLFFVFSLAAIAVQHIGA